jgi:hypothetical protein
VLPDSVLAWSSSLQGELGKGDSLVLNNLVSGTHTIRLTGTDGFGKTSVDSIALIILSSGVELIAILEAESDMIPIAQISRPDGSIGWSLRTNGYLVSKDSIDFPQPGGYDFLIFARGDEFQGWPLINLQIDSNIIVDSIEINSSVYTVFVVSEAVEEGYHKVAIEFFNDLWEPGVGDRNLYLDKMAITTASTGVEEDQTNEAMEPKNFMLAQNYPNPFNPNTVIRYGLPNPGKVKLTIYNILGQKVITLVDQYQESGHQVVNWDGKDDQGNQLSSGIYFCRLQAGDFSETKKMVLLR